MPKRPFMTGEEEEELVGGRWQPLERKPPKKKPPPREGREQPFGPPEPPITWEEKTILERLGSLVAPIGRLFEDRMFPPPREGAWPFPWPRMAGREGVSDVATAERPFGLMPPDLPFGAPPAAPPVAPPPAFPFLEEGRLPPWGVSPLAGSEWAPFLLPEFFQLPDFRERETKIVALGESVALSPPVDFPPNFGGESERNQVDFLRTNALASQFVDATGNVITYPDALRLSEADPQKLITEVFFMGGGVYDSYTFMAGNLAWEGFGQDKYGAPELLEPKRAILANTGLGYQEKLGALFELYADFATQRIHSQLSSEAYNSLTPEQKADVDAKSGAGEVPLPLKPEPGVGVEPVNIEGLRESLEPFGVSVLDTYPFLSPISQAHLGRIPQDVLEQMAKYLSEQGLSWNDYLALSRPFFGGATAPGGRWGIPAQR